MNLGVINVCRQSGRFMGTTMRHFDLLPINIALILRGNFDLLRHIRVDTWICCHRQRHERCITHIRTPQQIKHRVIALNDLPQDTYRVYFGQFRRLHPSYFKPCCFLFYRIALCVECFPAHVIYNSKLAANFGKARIGVVFS